MMHGTADSKRTLLFISKATPGDDEFVTWLAPKLEAAGYEVFADIQCLEGGDRWRSVITSTLQDKTSKMLLCCSDSTLIRQGVLEEIGMALDVGKQINDQKFIIPLRLAPYKKVFGIGELQYIDFVLGWEQGLANLLETLEKRSVPKKTTNPHFEISQIWANYRKKFAHTIDKRPEELITNWVRVHSFPDYINYFECTGALNHEALKQACKFSNFPTEQKLRGFFSFATLDEVKEEFSNVGNFTIQSKIKVLDFLESGANKPDISSRDAKNLVSSLIRKGWEKYGQQRRFGIYAFSSQIGFYANDETIEVGKRVSWGDENMKRSSMLRNSSGGKVWQFGITATHGFWPFWHFKIKTRIVFAELIANKKSGQIIDDPSVQHKLRRKVCSLWRNKQWHGRMMAFLQILSEGRVS